MGFGIDRRARPRRARTGLRGLISRAPDPRELGDRLSRIARRVFKGHVIDASPRRITLRLHPAASPVRIAVLPDAALEVRAETSAIGPGYHADVLARLAPILEELELTWEDDDVDPRVAMAAWLGGELEAGATRVGMPADRTFKLDAAVLTAMGPRDRAWCDRVIADPIQGADAFAWWDDGPGRRERSRALLAMWLEVPWREPIDDDERNLMERVDEDLRAARKAAPDLELPWAEWAELVAWLGGEDAMLAELTARAGDTVATIGYRRHAMEVELAGGWVIELPGTFVGAWDDEAARYWATDGERAVEFTSLTATNDQDSQQLLDVAPERHEVVARITEDARRGRAEAYDEGELRVMHGLMTAAPEIAILTCKARERDDAWAIATWRSLRNVNDRA